MKRWRTKRTRSVALLVAATTAVLLPGPTRGAPASRPGLRILSVTPGGEDVPPGRQIVLQFDRPVVPVGRMERDRGEIPVTLEPPLECEWRWLNTSALACQLGEKEVLRPATRYRLVVRPGLVALDGATLATEHHHEFVTQRPGVAGSYFRTWLSPGTPEILLYLNQPVRRESLERHLFFSTPGGERFALQAQPPEGVSQDRGRQELVVTPRRELPLETAMQLRVESGLESLQGPEPSLESKTVLELHTFPEPRFLGVRCRANPPADKEIWFRPGSARSAARLAGAKASRGCNPLSRVQLVFASPLTREVLQQHLVVEPDLAGGREDYDPWQSASSYSRLGQIHRAGQLYAVTLPEMLQAGAAYRLRGKAAELLDEFGRPLPGDVNLEFRTDHRPPSAVLTHPLSVLERAVDTHLPVVVTNLEEIRAGFRRLTPDGSQAQEKVVPVPRAADIAFPFPLQVRQWLGGRSGAVFGYLSTQPPSYRGGSRRFFSQVTPFQVHVKLGHLDTAVWVTDLASGEPVEGARVRLYVDSLSSLEPDPQVLSEGLTGPGGLARLAGNSELDPRLELAGWLRLWDPLPRLFVRVDKQGEMALLPLVRQFSVRSEGPNNTWIPAWPRARWGHIRAWGTTAQGVYRVGDRVQYKIYVRDQDSRRFVAAPRQGYTLRVFDPMGKKVHQRDEVELSDFGAFDGELRIAESGAVGWYRFELAADFTDAATWQPLRVLVADFTPAPFRVTTDLNGLRFRPGQEVVVSTAARLHAGGPFAHAEARITASLDATPLRTAHPKAQGFYFQTAYRGSQSVHQVEAPVNAQGDLESRFTLVPTGILHGRLSVESAVRDDRGKYVSSRAAAAFMGRDRFVGVRQKDWLLKTGDSSEFAALVLDEADQIVSGVEVVMQVEYRETRAGRVKGAGNAYLTRYVHEWREVDRCVGVSSGRPTVCELTPERPGLYRMTAIVRDSRDREHRSVLRRWAYGKGRVIWETPPGHQLPIEPEKAEYRVGETARFLIRNPFPGGRALLTVERLGVQRSWSRVLQNASELVEIEVTPDQVPGFYFSCVVTSPRVDRAAGPGEVDLGKPAFRMGYVRVPVRDPYKEIEVEVTPHRQTVRPRETVRVDLRARPRHADGEGLPRMELAVAVLDEAVFDLLAQGSAAFDPYRGFYHLEPLDLQNFNLLTRLIGIQNFEKKGANAGGGGAAGPELRSLFKFVSYWNPSLPTDPEGRATIEFPVPDNLTGWRVLALAVTPEDLMGLGQGSFAVDQPIELRPALPNQVVEGDRFEARFTVMNRTESTRIIRLRASVQGPAESPGLRKLRLRAEPFQRYRFGFPVRSTSDGVLEITVEAAAGAERDALRLPLTVRKRVALEAAASYGTTRGPEVSEIVAFPEGIRTDVGRVSLLASPSVIGGVDGAFRYLRDYPYLCWEQRLTKGVMASHFAHLRTYLPAAMEWPGHQELPDRTLASAANFQAPNGGMVYWIPEDRYVSPYLSAYTALAFEWLRERGHGIPAGVEEKLHGYLQRLLRREVFPDFYSRGMASSVRAVALAALARRGVVDRGDLERYRRHVADMDLFGKAHFLLAAVALDAAEDLRQEVQRGILSHVNQSGGKLVFSEAVDTSYQRILHSGPRSQCAILSALLGEQGGGPASPPGLGDMPFKLTRAITQERQRRDRWENTQENVFCMNALVDFSQAYEKVPPEMTVRAYLDGRQMGSFGFRSVRDASVELDRPIQPGDPGRQARLEIERQGSGRLYYATRLFYSPQEFKTHPTNAGLQVKREYSVERDGQWVLLESPMRVARGELVRVDLYLSLPAARNFVVVDDPVPGGLEPVNRDLATASATDADKGRFLRAASSYWFSCQDWRGFGYSRWSFYHRELRHEAARFYSDYLPAGNYHLTYVAQAIAPGEFQVPPLHAEEMYDPDVFGQGVPAKLVVESEEGGP